MVSQFSIWKGLLLGFALSLLGAALFALAIWTLPSAWIDAMPVTLRMIGGVALIYLPGLWRSIQLWHADRPRQAWSTFAGSTIGTVLLTLLGALLVAIAIAQALPRHD